jgi:hypothetical protein
LTLTQRSLSNCLKRISRRNPCYRNLTRESLIPIDP